jgi:hypothetical protein
MGRWLDDLGQDIRYGLRGMRLHAGLAVGIVVTLAPGRTYLFAFEGTRPSGAFSLKSCAVNGVACTKFGR